ncbi:MAG: type II toxin-antitoxin system Phd/YefM family antitoxin [Anaerolineae bacterium]|jgi:prevent-host-death family protein
MAEIGVRELKARASAILRRVRDQGARYVVTYRGRPVGLLLPLEGIGEPSLVAGESGAAVWEELTRLGEEIGRGWQSPLTGAELLSEMRR